MKQNVRPRINCAPDMAKNATPHSDTILSKHTFMPLDTRQTLRNNNVFILGDSQESIRDSFVIPNILQGNCSYVIHDTDGELCKRLSEPLKQMGYDIRVLNLADMTQSRHYNPLRYLHSAEEILHLAFTLVPNNHIGTDSEPIGDKSERVLLLSLLFYIQSEYEPDKRNFSAIFDILHHGQNSCETLSFLDDLFAALEHRAPEHLGVQFYKEFRSLNPRTIGTGYFVSLAFRLIVFNIPGVNSLTATDDMDLLSVGDKPVALFCIPNRTTPETNVILQMLYTQLLNTLYYHAEYHCDRYHLPRQVRIFLDNSESTNWLWNLPNKISTMRPYNISCCITASSLSYVKACYPADWEIVLGNCDTYIFFGMKKENATPDDLKFLEQKFGPTQYIRDLRGKNCLSRRGFRSPRSGRRILVLDGLFNLSVEDCLIRIKGVDVVWDMKF